MLHGELFRASHLCRGFSLRLKWEWLNEAGETRHAGAITDIRAAILFLASAPYFCVTRLHQLSSTTLLKCTYLRNRTFTFTVPMSCIRVLYTRIHRCFARIYTIRCYALYMHFSTNAAIWYLQTRRHYGHVCFIHINNLIVWKFLLFSSSLL